MSNYIIVDGELYHHGVKGMKWGVRKKYQTNGRRLKSRREMEREFEEQRLRKERTRKVAKGVAAGAAAAAVVGGHVAAGVVGAKAYKKRADANDVGVKTMAKRDAKSGVDWVNNNPDKIKGGLNIASKSITDKKKTLLDNRTEAVKAKARDVDVSEMSDNYLRETVKRYKLEKSYKDMLAEQAVEADTGRKHLETVMSVVGGVLSTAATAASIYFMVADHRKKG